MHKYKESLWSNFRRSLLFSSMMGLTVTLILIMLFTLFVYVLMDNSDGLKGWITISLIAGAFLAGMICGRHRRRKGLLEGVLCGLIMFSILILLGLIFIGSPSQVIGIKKLLLTTIPGGIGGAIGVNMKRPPKL